MEPSNRTNRTWLCSVIFMDIVGYSIRSVTHQARIKARFNTILTSAIRSVPAADRIVLDTGDGAAICFLGDPEDVLFAALELRAAFAASGDDQATPPFEVRIGVNLGPVKLIHDVNGSLNAIGDGINVAQRVMSFADPNTVLVSRSFYEVVSCLSEEYERLFQLEGIRKDKHIREHTVYALQIPDGALVMPPRHGRTVMAPTPLPEEFIARMEAELSQALGPVSRVVVRRAAATATSPSELAEQLAADFLEGPTRDAFLRKFSVPAAAFPATPPAAPAPASAAEHGVASSINTRPLEDLLAEFVGPMARVLIKRASAKAANVSELLQLVKDEIPAGKERASFLKRAELLEMTRK